MPIAQLMPIALTNAPLTAVIEADAGQFTACCPELDLALAADSPDLAFEELIEAALQYAREYMDEEEIYRQSPNRGSHYGLVQRIVRAAASSPEQVRCLFAVRS